jgi:hypothetical protein
MFSAIVWVAIGYVVHSLFPLPFIDRAILDGWARFWAYVKAKVSSAPDTTTTTTPTSVPNYSTAVSPVTPTKE